jgi:spore cortex formation protein SpoVR/YcgB (stage V sporulation)
LGHADFSNNNMLFRRCQEQVSEHIVEHAAAHARQIERDIEPTASEAVEQVLDAALSLEQYIDVDQMLRRERLSGVSCHRRCHRWTMPFVPAMPRSMPAPPQR